MRSTGDRGLGSAPSVHRALIKFSNQLDAGPWGAERQMSGPRGSLRHSQDPYSLRAAASATLSQAAGRHQKREWEKAAGFTEPPLRWLEGTYLLEWPVTAAHLLAPATERGTTIPGVLKCGVGSPLRICEPQQEPQGAQNSGFILAWGVSTPQGSVRGGPETGLLLHPWLTSDPDPQRPAESLSPEATGVTQDAEPLLPAGPPLPTTADAPSALPA